MDWDVIVNHVGSRKMAGYQVGYRSRLSTIGKGVTAIYLLLGLILLYLSLVMQPGLYHGYFGGGFTVDAGDTHGPTVVHAETAPQWYWMRPSNHRYNSATLRTFSDREVKLNLLDATWQSGQDKGTLNTESLACLLASVDHGSDRTAEYESQIEALLDFLEAMRNGTAPPPRHHRYYIESPISASYQHHTSGRNDGLMALCVWAVAWPVLLSVIWALARKARYGPAVVYGVVLAVIVGLDIVLTVIGLVTSPGSVAEHVEFLLAVVNLPAWAILGDRLVLSWLGLVIGALGWATVASTGDLLRRTD
jgi:hypothetical protein